MFETPLHPPIQREHKWNLLCVWNLLYLEDTQEKLWLNVEKKVNQINKDIALLL